MFRIRMEDEDRECINQAASNEGETASEWARQVLLKAAKRSARVSKEKSRQAGDSNPLSRKDSPSAGV